MRLCRRSTASWGLDRYWGSSACSNRMENGTMEPDRREGETERETGGEDKKKKKTGDEEKMCEGKMGKRNRVG